MAVHQTLTNDHFFWKTKAWTKKFSLLFESIIYDGADDEKMLSVDCLFLIKFYITRNQ